MVVVEILDLTLGIVNLQEIANTLLICSFPLSALWAKQELQVKTPPKSHAQLCLACRHPIKTSTRPNEKIVKDSSGSCSEQDLETGSDGE